MQILDPGHSYVLNQLDEPEPKYGWSGVLMFVKRVGEGYPGNMPPPNAGTTLQEVLRACCDRLRYVDKQMADKRNKEALRLVRKAILLLEQQAAKRHGRPYGNLSLDEAEFGECCLKCNHVGCEGSCH